MSFRVIKELEAGTKIRKKTTISEREIEPEKEKATRKGKEKEKEIRIEESGMNRIKKFSAGGPAGKTHVCGSLAAN